MHFEFLVEDASGKLFIESIINKLLGDGHTHRIIAYKGVGNLPSAMSGNIDASHRILLDRLPQLLRGYGKSLQYMEAAVVVVVDLDSRDRQAFETELQDLLNTCDPAPIVIFSIAVEELEAWLLGDREALLAAYPQAKRQVLARYQQDSVCGTWELLADAIHKGGASALKSAGWPAPGQAKCAWAARIGAHIDLERNRSQSFQAFRDGLRALAAS